MRKQAFLHLVLTALLMALPAVASAFTPSGLLEIHYINVGWGTSVLVIGPNGTTMLMDGGREGQGTSHVIPYMESLGLMPSDGLNYMLNSHLHTDHFSGLTEVINGGYDVHQRIYYNGSNNSNQYITAFRNAAATTTADSLTAIPLGTIIQLGSGATATCVCANGSVIGHGPVGGTSDENDKSIGILIQYGNFDYLFAGDLGGGQADQSCTGRHSSYANVETPLAQAIKPSGEHPLLSSYGVEVLHVNHHGSEGSTNSDYMNLLTPHIACVATGSGQSADYMFPRHNVVDHVLLAGVSCIAAPAAIVLQGEEGYPAGSSTSYSGYCVGNFSIKTSGAANYIVNGDGAVTEGPDERVALGMPLTIPFDEPQSDITPPAVTVSVPNGGESWASLSVHNITWTATDAVGVTAYAIDYSTNSGTNWLAVQAQTSGNPQTFAWTVPSTISSNCLVKVRAWDAANNVGNDQSNAVFSIVAPADTTVPTVVVTSPNGGESWIFGSIHNITWNASDNIGVTQYKLDYSTDGGTGWLSILDWTSGNPGTYSWTIPGTLSALCRVKVSGKDAANNIGSDISNGNFTIYDPPPQVTVTSPDGGESWIFGSVHNITWSATDNIGVTQYKLDYSTDGGTGWLSILDWTSGNPGTYSWTVPGTLSALCRVKVSGKDAANNIGFDISNGNFSIYDPPPQVTVTSPNGGETWDCGSSHNITWTDSDNLGVVACKIENSSDAGFSWSLIQDWIAGDLHTYAWIIPNTPATLNRIRLTCRDTSGGIGSDNSNNNFIIRDNTSPIVSITSPIGGENWDAGSTHDITWGATDNIGVTSYKLDYSIDCGASWLLVHDWTSGNPGTFSWAIPDSPSAQCRVKVTCRDGAGVAGFDTSDSNFIITDTSPPTVSVSSPNGGESWGAASINNITWSASDNIGVTQYKLDYSTDSGTSWLSILDWTSGNPGTYSWTVPSTLSTLCRVKVSSKDAADNIGSDISNGNFTIYDPPPQVTVTSPNGGETWDCGSSHNITWTSSDNIGVTSFKLDYSFDSGVNWLSIQDWTSGDPHTYSWTLPESPSTDCLVRVSCKDTSREIGSDNSNDNFIIRDNTPPAVSISAPIGGESWEVGSNHDITWTATDAVGVTAYAIDYSTNSGTNWLAVQAQTSGNPQTFACTVPSTVSSNCLVKVRAWDAANNVGNDQSNALFSIIPSGDTSSPVVLVISPNGGEIWGAGSVQNITWSASDNIGVTQYKLDYSTDGGTGWLSILDWTSGNPETYSWTVPGTLSALCRVKVSGKDAADNIGSDISNGNFTIYDPPPQVTVTSPNGGETWACGSSHNITWTSSDNIGVISFKLDYSLDSGANWLTIQDWTSGDPHSFLWTLPESPSTECRVKVSCRNTSNNVASDNSDNNFTIGDGTSPIVDLTYPNGDEIFDLGNSIAIIYNCYDNIGCTQAKFEYSTDSGSDWQLIRDWGTLTISDWTPSLPGEHYRIRVSARDAAGNVGSDFSTGDFAVRDVTSPSVTLISPNGGENWATEVGYNITWTASDNVGVTSFKLEYSIDSGTSWMTIQDWISGNPGSQLWMVPQPPSAYCLVRVSCRDAALNVTADISNNTFTIAGAAPCDYIVGDINGNHSTNGVDVVFGVAYFKGGPPPPYSCECPAGHIWYVMGDVNASCNFNGVDVTYMVAYFKGGLPLNPCPDCPPPLLTPPGPLGKPGLLFEAGDRR